MYHGFNAYWLRHFGATGATLCVVGSGRSNGAPRVLGNRAFCQVLAGSGKSFKAAASAGSYITARKYHVTLSVEFLWDAAWLRVVGAGSSAQSLTTMIIKSRFPRASALCSIKANG